MMSSKSIKLRKKALVSAEAKIKSELNEVSDLFETKTKNILVISAISGAVLLSAYGIYSLINRSDTPTNSKRKKRKSSLNFQKVILENATNAAVNYLAQEFQKSFDKKK